VSRTAATITANSATLGAGVSGAHMHTFTATHPNLQTTHLQTRTGTTSKTANKKI
jgi:hypothetical protein